MKVILSIKPKFANKIFDGTKSYEYRRSIFKNKEVKTVIVYASAPISKVIGEFTIDYILKETLVNLWDITKDDSGIDEEYYNQYFSGKLEGYAIRIKSSILYDNPRDIAKHYKAKAPQSFLYLR